MKMAFNYGLVLVLTVLGTVVTFAQAGYVDGTIFSDDFSVDGAPNSTNWPTAKAGNSTLAVADGAINLQSTEPVIAPCYANIVSKSFTLGTEYAAEIRFLVAGDTILSNENHIPYSLILSDGNDGQKGGFDVNLFAATSSTFNLTWGYWGGGANGLTTIATLNKDTWYTVISHRKSDGTVDIYLDDTIIATKNSLPGTPSKWMIGDGYGSQVTGHVKVDYVKLGSYVPEPCSMMLLVPAMFGLLARRGRKQK